MNNLVTSCFIYQQWTLIIYPIKHNLGWLVFCDHCCVYAQLRSLLKYPVLLIIKISYRYFYGNCEITVNNHLWEAPFWSDFGPKFGGCSLSTRPSLLGVYECMVWDLKSDPSASLLRHSFLLYLRNSIPIIIIDMETPFPCKVADLSIT